MTAVTYSLFHKHTQLGSILDSTADIEKSAAYAKKIGLNLLSVSDHGSVASHIQHITACKKHGVRYACGIELYCSYGPAFVKTPENRSSTHMVIWAKNKVGWKSLIALSNQTNEEENYYYRPRIGLFDTVIEIDGVKQTKFGLEHFVNNSSIQGFSGHTGSHLNENLYADVLTEQPAAIKEKLSKAYKFYKEANNDPRWYKKFLKPNWLESTCELALRFEKMFGKGNFFIELQDDYCPKDDVPLLFQPHAVECLREVSKQTGIPAMASSDPHYIEEFQHAEQKVLLMCNLGETEATIKQKLESDDEHLFAFFGSTQFYMHTPEEMLSKFTQEELDTTNRVADEIEQYEITAKPILPKYKLPEFDKTIQKKFFTAAQTDSDLFLGLLAINGAKEIKPWLVSGVEKSVYWDRLIEEADTLFSVGISGYFIIVRDICAAAQFRPADHSFDWELNLKNNGKTDPIAMGYGRGSSGGCLFSYLIGITGVDPLLYDLSFGRFFDKSRFPEMPDIDLDFDATGRDWIISYLKWKFGINNVAQIVTFGKLQGRSTIRDLMRVKGVENHIEVAGEICKHIPPGAFIADEIQEEIDDGNLEYGILQWSIDHKEELKPYYEKYKAIIDQAISMEDLTKSKGRHPSGVVVTETPIEDNFPMIWDTRSKSRIIGFDYKDAALAGAVKIDILGLSTLSRLKRCEDLVNGVK